MDKNIFRWWDMCRTAVLFALLLLSTDLVSAIKVIGNTQVISAVNGSDTGVIMDCRYQLEKNDTDGLVIKWYYNEGNKPVYQWIIGTRHQALGILNDRLDLTYTASMDKFLIYRALAVRRPTTELSGKYTCEVSNYAGEYEMHTKLIVYSPATFFNITVDDTMDSIKVECFADGLYPRPQMKLIKEVLGSSKTHINDIETKISQDTEKETYNIYLSKYFKLSQLESSVDFSCYLSIHETNYKEKRRITHLASGSGAKAYFTTQISLLAHLVFATLLAIAFK